MSLVLLFLKNPVMPTDLKVELVEYALSKATTDDMVSRFFAEVVEAQRVNLLPQIYLEFRDLLDAKQNRVRCEIKAARSLSVVEKAAVEKSLCKLLGKDVLSEVVVDPAIVGGFIVRSKQFMLDTSIRNKIDKLIEIASY